ncbi:MAG: signal peptidase I [Clostridia bacterium]|nr:signal peptidase I [Clostridia bacterium]
MVSDVQAGEGEYRVLPELFEWAEAIVFSLAAVVLLFTFVFRIVGVDGQSMENTLFNGDRLVISRMSYTPKQGDVIVFPVSPSVETKPLIKRIIAVGGQTVNIDYKKGTVTVDGKVLSEPYIKEVMLSPVLPDPVNFPLTVPKGKVFVMGDNRNNSLDGRSGEIGFVDTRDILGRVLFRIFPLNEIGALK